MVRPTHDEIIRQLSKDFAILGAYRQEDRADILRIDSAHAKTAEVVADLRRQLAVFEERLGELKKGLEESSRKRWALMPALLGALSGGLITSFTHFLLFSLRR
jgi:hypothetical protein